MTQTQWISKIFKFDLNPTSSWQGLSIHIIFTLLLELNLFFTFLSQQNSKHTKLMQWPQHSTYISLNCTEQLRRQTLCTSQACINCTLILLWNTNSSGSTYICQEYKHHTNVSMISIHHRNVFAEVDAHILHGLP